FAGRAPAPRFSLERLEQCRSAPFRRCVPQAHLTLGGEPVVRSLPPSRLVPLFRPPRASTPAITGMRFAPAPVSQRRASSMAESQTSRSKQLALVTGASSGIGLEL